MPTTSTPIDRPLEDPEAALERALIEEFFRARGLDSSALHGLPEDEAARLRVDAFAYAAMKLAEVEARAHFVHELHRNE